MSMDSGHKRHNSPFATPEKGLSDKKPAVSPSDTFGGKKGFLSLFSKKKATGGFDADQGAKQIELEGRAKARQKIVNRKNIADGKIRLDVVPNDRVPEDFLIDYKDNPFEWLDQAPSVTKSYIENLRSRDFSQINNREVRQFLESQHKKEIAPPTGVENLEIELLEISKSYDEFLAKFFRFFQGVLPGFCVISMFLIFAGSDDQAILNSFVLSAIRVYQIFHIVALICVVGSFHRYAESMRRYLEAARMAPMQKGAIARQATRYLIASISFMVTYGIIVFNHEFVSKLSDRAGAVYEADFRESFKVFRPLSAIMTAFAIIGWFTLNLAFEEVNNIKVDAVNYSEMTADESMEENIRNA